ETDKRFAQLADAQRSYEERQGRLEASFQLLEGFVRDFRNETNDRFAETDRRLALLAEAQAKTDEQMKRTDERINALIEAQVKADERINQLFNRNGRKPKARPKKAVKKRRGTAK